MKSSNWFSVIIPTLNEEKNIGQLIRSINNQDYRPIEVVIVDGGSKDRTVNIVKTLIKECEEPLFTIKLIFQGNQKGLARARNIGLQESRGEYVAFLDADVVLGDTNHIKELAEALGSHPMTWYRQKMSIDSWIEYNFWVDQGCKECTSPAFRRDTLGKVMFDPNLGVGDDQDFLVRLRESGILTDSIPTIHGEATYHVLHTMAEYTIGKFWYGRAIWAYVRKRPRSLLTALLPTGPFLLLLFAAITSFMSIWISIFCLAAWSAGVVYFFVKSKIKNLVRLTFILMNLSYGSLIRTVGCIVGLFDCARGTPSLGRGI